MENLPTEILLLILSYLPTSDLFSLSFVSHRFLQLTQDPNLYHHVQIIPPCQSRVARLFYQPCEDMKTLIIKDSFRNNIQMKREKSLFPIIPLTNKRLSSIVNLRSLELNEILGSLLTHLKVLSVLKLENLELDGRLVRKVFTLPNLTHVSLGNRFNFSSFKRIALPKNQIKSFSFTFTGTFTAPHCLSFLLDSVSETLEEIQIKAINKSQYIIWEKFIFPIIGTFPRLHSIDLQGFTDCILPKVYENLKGLTKLIFPSFYYNGHTGLTLQNVLIQNSNSLVYLDLSSINLLDANLINFPIIPSLETLKLNNNPLLTWLSLNPFLTQCQSMKNISISSCHSLIDSLFALSSLHNLKSLDASKIISNDITLIQDYKNFENLTSLHCSISHADNQSFISLLESFKNLKSIILISNLSLSYLNDDLLEKLIINCPQIETLSLMVKSCFITDKGFVILSRLKRLKTLRLQGLTKVLQGDELIELGNNCRDLTELCLAEIGLIGNQVVFSRIHHILRTFEKLKVFKLYQPYWRMTDAFIDTLKSLENLEVIEIVGKDVHFSPELIVSVIKHFGTLNSFVIGAAENKHQQMNKKRSINQLLQQKSSPSWLQVLNQEKSPLQIPPSELESNWFG